jgi:hypothetical protein
MITVIEILLFTKNYLNDIPKVAYGTEVRYLPQKWLQPDVGRGEEKINKAKIPLSFLSGIR